VRWQGRRTGHALVERLAGSLAQASAALSSETGEAYYLFAEVPAQDADVAQALGLAGWRLVETRLTYYSSPLPAIDAPRSPVRWANEADVSHLREVASSAANPYDRYHADPFFGPDVASRYLATYVEQSVRGFASGVLVPAPGDGRPAGAFFTALVHHRGACPLGVPHECDLDLGLGRIPLVAVSDDRKGWHARLLAEMLRYFAKEELDVVLMTTQLANRPVIRNCEKLGLRLGSAAHVFATHPRAHRLGQA
jgi:dTDP-4-amino-4,6-dideoxy-D-galactose acyltransferase